MIKRSFFCTKKKDLTERLDKVKFKLYTNLNLMYDRRFLYKFSGII